MMKNGKKVIILEIVAVVYLEMEFFLLPALLLTYDDDDDVTYGMLG